jgi:hypothetical protein
MIADLLSAQGIAAVAARSRVINRPGTTGDAREAAISLDWYAPEDGPAHMAVQILTVLGNELELPTAEARATFLAGILHDLATAAGDLERRKIAEWAVVRAQWLESEADGGGDAPHLRIRAEEARSVGALLDRSAHRTKAGIANRTFADERVDR